ncbi:MAG: STAS domain-containing protein [Spirochaetota bacterium]
MEIIEKDGGSVRIAVLEGDLTADDGMHMRDVILDAMRSPSCRRLYFDMSNVRFIGSSGLGVLLFGLRRLREQKKELAICNVAPPVRKLFQDIRLDAVLPMDEKVTVR